MPAAAPANRVTGRTTLCSYSQRVEAAYMRRDLFERRYTFMQSWAARISGAVVWMVKVRNTPWRGDTAELVKRVWGMVRGPTPILEALPYSECAGRRW